MKTNKLQYLAFLLITLILIGLISSCKSTGPDDNYEFFLQGQVTDLQGNTITGAEVYIRFDVGIGITTKAVCDSIIPVELSSFTAVLTTDCKVRLTWVTEQETNLLGFRVYRSETNDVASAITITPMLINATNTSSTQVYSIEDREVVSNTTYWYWLESVDYDHSCFHGPVSVYVETPYIPELPLVSVMHGPYPNPFNVNTNIEIGVPADHRAELKISHPWYGILRSFNTMSPGSHIIVWDGKNAEGEEVANGLYQIESSFYDGSDNHVIGFTKNVMIMNPDLSNLPCQVTDASGYKIPLQKYFQFGKTFEISDDMGNDIGPHTMDGEFTMVVKKAGYETQSRQVSITDFNRNHMIDFVMEAERRK